MLAFYQRWGRRLYRLRPVFLLCCVAAVLAFFWLVFAASPTEAQRWQLSCVVLGLSSFLLWLWATVLFANVAESIAEGRGKAAADSLRATRVTTKAKLIVDPETGMVIPTNASDLEIGSVILVEAGELTEEEAEVSERRNIILQALGPEAAVKVATLGISVQTSNPRRSATS